MRARSVPSAVQRRSRRACCVNAGPCQPGTRFGRNGSRRWKRRRPRPPPLRPMARRSKWRSCAALASMVRRRDPRVHARVLPPAPPRAQSARRVRTRAVGRISKREGVMREGLCALRLAGLVGAPSVEHVACCPPGCAPSDWGSTHPHGLPSNPAGRQALCCAVRVCAVASAPSASRVAKHARTHGGSIHPSALQTRWRAC